MFNIEYYIASVSNHLSKETEIIKEYIRGMNKLNISQDVKNLIYTIYIEPTNKELNFVLFAYDNQANEVMGIVTDGKQTSSVSSQDITYFSFSEQDIIDFEGAEDFLEENDWEIYTKEQATFYNWFLSNWKSVTDSHHTIPTYVSIHDDDKVLDLRNEKWISSEELWKG